MAAPISAFAPTITCSAARMSGRRRMRSVVRPVGVAGRGWAACGGVGRRASPQGVGDEGGAARDPSGVIAEKRGNPILLLGDLAAQVGDRRGARIERGARPLDRQAAVAAGVVAQREELVHLAEGGFALLRDGKLAVEL